MLDSLFNVSRTFSIPTGAFGTNGEPTRATATLRTSQIVSMTEADRSAFGTVNATKTLFVHPEDTAPQINATFAEGSLTYTVRAYA